jgi:hypothetical protein
MLPARFANAPTLLTRNLNQNVVYLPENSCNSRKCLLTQVASYEEER